MNRYSILSLSLLLGILCVETSLGQDASTVFNRGTEYYRAGKYDEAAMEYQAIINQGLVSAEVYFNLGDACYRQGKIAQAILAYERAQRLRPGDADIQHNLRLVNFKTLDRIEPVPELFIIQWLRSYASIVSFALSMKLLMIGWIVFFLSLAGVYVVRHAQTVRILRWSVLGAALLIAFSGSTMAGHSMLSHGNDQAIIVVPVVTAKSSPDEQSVDAFVVHEGLKVKLSDTLGDWVKITLADGKVGWVHGQQCERI
jgi:hypothetical protein